MQRTLKWSAAQPIKKPDNILSSKARETGDYGFKPSYLAEPKEDMRFIMSNEYMRIWFNEKGKYEKDTYSREQIIKEESKIKRRFVQRMMTYKKPDKNYFLEEKVGNNPRKKEEKDQPIDYRKFKYKPVCLKTKNNLTTKERQGQKGVGQTHKGTEKDNSVDSKNADENQPVIICQVSPNRSMPCPCTCKSKN